MEQPMVKLSTLSRIAERILLGVGVFLITFYVVARIEGVVTLHAAMRAFEEAKAHAETGNDLNTGTDARAQAVDFSLWSEDRIKAYKDSLKRHADPPLAVLRIPKLHIVAPVLEGTSDFALNAGVGRISGTARPGERGNIGIAGHRDGFFRGLKDIAQGDTIELENPRGTQVYVVDRIYLTNPDDVSVLRSGKSPLITLVTCYPFYYIGSAPQRYIVQASLKQQTGSREIQH
jgi:sortase A